MRPASNLILFIAAILLLLSGCASAPRHLSVTDQQKIRNVAIVSLVPENIKFSKIMIVGAEHAGFSLGGKVADAVNFISRNRIAQAHPGWVVKNIEYDRSALLAKVKAGNGFSAARVEDFFANLARANNLDAIFVVRAAADQKDESEEQFKYFYLNEGLNVLLKADSLSADAKLFIGANLGVTVISRDGKIMASGAVSAEQVKGGPLNLDDYDVRSNMKHNLRPEVVARLGAGAIADLTKRLNLCFDSLGFAGKPAPEPESAKAVLRSRAMPSVPSKTDPFDLCFKRCRQYTDRSKNQCFDACNR